MEVGCPSIHLSDPMHPGHPERSRDSLVLMQCVFLVIFPFLWLYKILSSGTIKVKQCTFVTQQLWLLEYRLAYTECVHKNKWLFGIPRIIFPIKERVEFTLSILNDYYGDNLPPMSTISSAN